MDGLEQLDACATEFSASLRVLSDYFHSPGYSHPKSTLDLLVPSNAPPDIHSARRSAQRSINRLLILLTDPEDLIQRLACQAQLLSCLRWLGEFQILACIPPTGSVSTKDVADLMGVEESQLTGVVRMTATAGFLHEPQPGCLSHTGLSAPFVTQLFYLDALMFLAQIVTPSALHMAVATKLHGPYEGDHRGPGVPIPTNASAYAAAFHTTQTFEAVSEQQPKLQRQWPAFLRCIGDTDDSATQVLARLDWPSQGNVRIVDVAAHSTHAAQALVKLFPALQFVVQLGETAPANEAAAQTEPGSRIVVQRRTVGTPQPIKDAAVYVLRVPPPAPGVGLRGTDTGLVLSELRAHLAILRDRPSAIFVLAFRPVPDPGTVRPDVEALARTRDLTRMQLTGGRDTDIEGLTTMINSVHDGIGRLVVLKKLHSGTSATVAIGVKYQAASNGNGHVDHSSIL
ncbi:hypothetical protein BJ170DRAFT_684584 [Xylariales sp. AK1849]|nr:hypothetical protein BJ170DRAFT_684584 [Xylariales sp. AK1849]